LHTIFYGQPPTSDERKITTCNLVTMIGKLWPLQWRNCSPK